MKNADLINDIQAIDLRKHAHNVEEHRAIRSFRRAVIRLIQDYMVENTTRRSAVLDISPEGPIPGEVHDCTTGKPVKLTTVKPLHPPVRPIGEVSEGIIPPYQKEYTRESQNPCAEIPISGPEECALGNLRMIVVAALGGVGAMSPEKYQITLDTIANTVGREVDDEFRVEVEEILRSLPCPLD